MIPSHLHCSYQHSVLVGRPRGSEHIAVLERIASLVRLVEHSLENSLQIVTVNRLFSVVTRSRGAQPPSPSPPPDAGTFIASAAARAAANACAAGAVTAVAAVGRVSCLNNLPLVSIIWLKKKEVLFFIAVERTGQKKINQKSNKKTRTDQRVSTMKVAIMARRDGGTFLIPDEGNNLNKSDLFPVLNRAWGLLIVSYQIKPLIPNTNTESQSFTHVECIPSIFVTAKLFQKPGL